jgi:hypothetical protein
MISLFPVPLVWGLVERLLDPHAAGNHAFGIALQIAAALVFPVLGIGYLAMRYRVGVDSEKRTVHWTRRILGMQDFAETWRAEDIEALEMVTARGKGSLARKRSPEHRYAVHIVGPRGRRMMRNMVRESEAEEAGKSWSRDLGVPFRDERRSSPDVSGLPRKGEFAGGLVLAAIGIPMLFRVLLGERGMQLGIALTTFCIMVAAAARYLSAIPSEERTKSFSRGRFDFLSVVWLLSIPFGPFIGWSCTEGLTAGNWALMAGVRAAVCILVPVICVLPMLRAIRGRHALGVGLVVLAFTAYPIVIGLGAAFDFLGGPVWQGVEVEGIRDEVLRIRGLGVFSEHNAYVDLADGRTLRPVEGVSVHEGKVDLLILRGLGRILDSRED